MPFCLPEESVKRFIDALKSGEIDPVKTAALSSINRRTFFNKIVGEKYGTEVNAQFESKLLLKDQKRGLVTFAKKVSGITPQVRRDMLARIEKMDRILTPETERAFLADLVAKKLGTEVTIEEANNIASGIKEVVRLREAIPENAPIRGSSRMRYGTAETIFREYIDALKEKSPKTTTVRFKDWITDPGKVIKDIAGATKSLLASLDNSYWLRQGIKVLFTPFTGGTKIWSKNFIKSFSDIAIVLKGKKGTGLYKRIFNSGDAMTAIKADIVSRPNALNGKYKAGKYDLGIEFEEAFPSSAPESIPLLGKFFKASETAFNGGALRIRADLADNIIKSAERNKVNTLDPFEAESLGKLTNSITGRGKVSTAPTGPFSAETINVTLFSIRFFKSNFDFLTAHRFDKNMSQFAKRRAKQNLAQVVGSVAAVLWIAEMLHPGSVETDPRSTDFGDIRIGDTRFDVTGGMSGLVTVASRITPSFHNGEFGFFRKSSTTGKYTKLNSGKFGALTALDIIEGYWEGKLSPFAAAIRDVLRGRNFEGETPTPQNIVEGLVVPIPVQTLQELQEESNSANTLAAMIAEFLGASANTFSRR